MTEPPIDRAVKAWFEDFAEQGIFTTDDRLVIVAWNRWLERHSGRMAADVLGTNLLDTFPIIRERGLDARYHDALAGQSHLISQLLHGHLLPMAATVGDPSLNVMPQRARISPLLDGDKVIGTITVIEDVSDRIASEHALRNQIDTQQAGRSVAEHALRAKDDFLANLSHEMRTPIHAVLGWTQILRTAGVPPEQFARGISVIERNTLLQARLIEDLLDTSRILSGKLRLHMEPVHIQAVLISVFEVMLPAADAKRLVMDRRLEAEGLSVLGDADRLHQVFLNLLSNAVKFTEPGGTVTCRTETRNGRLLISISDDGLGISPEFLPFVFDRFKQADVQTTRREAGLGLGLALVKELVGLHGGTVEAFSAGPRQGTCVTVDLPMFAPSHAAEPQATGSVNQESALRSIRGLHVVVLETDLDVRDFLQAALGQQGILVTLVRTPEEVSEALDPRRHLPPPDAILADIDLAERAGYSLIREVKIASGAGRKIAVIGLSASASAASRELLRSSGYDEQLAKPLDLAAILRAIGAATGVTSGKS